MSGSQAAQRRNIERDDVQAIKKIFPETFLGHRGSPDPDWWVAMIRASRIQAMRVAHRLELPVLDGAEDFRLQIEGQIADLVEKEGVAVPAS